MAVDKYGAMKPESEVIEPPKPTEREVKEKKVKAIIN